MTVEVCDPVQESSDCLESLRSALRGFGDNEVVQALRDLETLSRKTNSVILEVVAEVEARGIATREGFGSTARLLAGMLRLSAAEARTRVEHAAAVGARRGLTGEPLAPRLPATAAALSRGQLGIGQLRVITETLAALPGSVPEPVRQRVEADLARYGQDFAPRGLRVIAQRIVATLDPDGREPRDPTPSAPARGELWLRDRRDGRLGLEGWLDPEHGALVRSLIEQLAAPARTAQDPAAAGGAPDPRTVPQRQADALIELCERARTAAEFPTAGGEPPHLSVTIDWEALRTALGSATLDHGVPVSAGDARRLACDCVLIPVVLGVESEPLDVGRATRTVPRGIRRALVARDRGCSFPGCDRPPQLCACHHIRHWAEGGATSVGNCCLLCPIHHQQVHLQGWDITVKGGRVEFRPPAIIDPDRRPLTNPLRT
ncbi:MAG: DUF222 domain-containing protein [Pseudonocardiaceae bacterium]